MSQICANGMCTVIIRSNYNATVRKVEILLMSHCVAMYTTPESPEDVVHSHPKTKMICKCIRTVIDLPLAYVIFPMKVVQ